MKRVYVKSQTKWTQYPAVIDACRGDETIAVLVHPARLSGQPRKEPAAIYFDPQEAQGFAAWLSEQAEYLIAKQARAAARKAARMAAKNGGQQ